MLQVSEAEVKAVEPLGYGPRTDRLLGTVRNRTRIGQCWDDVHGSQGRPDQGDSSFVSPRRGVRRGLIRVGRSSKQLCISSSNPGAKTADAAWWPCGGHVDYSKSGPWSSLEADRKGSGQHQNGTTLARRPFGSQLRFCILGLGSGEFLIGSMDLVSSVSFSVPAQGCGQNFVSRTSLVSPCL